MAGETHYPVRAGALGGRYVTAKLGNMRVAREWLVQPTSDDRIIVQGATIPRPGKPYGGNTDAIGIFDFSGKGRLCTKGGYFPHLAIAEPFEFPQAFVATCMDVCQPLGAVTRTTVCTVEHTVQVVS